MSSVDPYILETPENIEVEFDLAGLGTRFCATLIDTLIIVAVFLGLGLLLLIILAASEAAAALGNARPFGNGPVEWVLAAMAAVVGVLASGGYYILFELLMRGRTPGKKAMRIRVIRDDGTPASAGDILVRNILRLVDFLPALYAVGAVTMFVHPLAKRLGDIAAGTIVVKEGALDYRARADVKYQLEARVPTRVNSELTAEERRLVDGFLHRRVELLPKAREELAERLARPLHEKYGGHFGDGESFLLRLSEGRHYEP